MTRDYWHEFARTIRVREAYPGPVRWPSDRVLDAYEARAGLKLPEGYRRFIRLFGPGELAGRFSIASPGYPSFTYRVDMDRLNEDFRRKPDDELEEFWDDPERARRMVMFCSTGGVNYFGWDPREVTDPARHEYAIYEVPQGLDTIPRRAGTFREFLEGYCLGDGHLEERGGEWDEEELGPRRSFVPAAADKARGRLGARR